MTRCPVTGCRVLDVPAQQLGAHLDWHAELTETDVLEGCAGCTLDELVDCCPVHDPQDLDAAAGVDPRTGVPLEQSSVHVRLSR